MYNLNEFCNIITNLRKNKGWTQTMLADKIGIAPQSVSKWECGIGYPDVTLFPVIADLLDVPIGVLFGEQSSQEEIIMSNKKTFSFEPLKYVEVKVGNLCRIETVNDEREASMLTVEGDPVFVEYFSVDKENGNLSISIKNPTGTDKSWVPYDRLGYEGKNIVRLFTGKSDCDCCFINYLDNLNLKNEDIDRYTSACECTAI